ncbi:tetratricopeptide repeat protein [Novipirellula sp. SH528]|uniref:tetratricopeptide repeat protein n=1 Tax=Novipirellula sp. SH528 TaxID=3454466 RepID=UPI003FA05D82
MAKLDLYPIIRDCTRGGNRISACFRTELIVLLVICAGVSPNTSHAQPPVENDGKIDALQVIHRELHQHQQRKPVLTQELQRIQATLKETERDMQSVREEALKKQISWQLLQMEEAEGLEDLQANDITFIDIRNRFIDDRRARTVNQAEPRDRLKLLNQQFIQNDQFTTASSLSQLDAASQRIIQRRQKAFQDGAKWQHDVMLWRQQGPMFFERYWRFTDPSRIWTRSECESLLSTFQTDAIDDYPAIIAQALLHERLGYHNDALEKLNQVIQANTPLHFTAIAARSTVYTSLGDLRKAKMDMLAAYKAERANPYIRYLRARQLATEENLSDAESELLGLLNTPELELDARRLLAVIYSLRAQKIPRLASKAKEQAMLVSEFSDKSDWFAQLLMAMASSVSDEPNFAALYADKSVWLASEDQKQLAEKMAAQIKSNAPMQWNFQRR